MFVWTSVITFWPQNITQHNKKPSPHHTGEKVRPSTLKLSLSNQQSSEVDVILILSEEAFQTSNPTLAERELCWEKQIRSLISQDAFGETSEGSEDSAVCEEIQGQEWRD